jgi:hypothetical protein
MSEILNRETWLQKMGFINADPFDHTAHFAECDPYRKECFEEFPYYGEVKGSLRSPGPVLIYAARGGGKSALRCQIEEEWNDTLISDNFRILPVVYDNFGLVLKSADDNYEKITLDHHLEQLIGLIISRLLDAVSQEDSLISLNNLEKGERRLLIWYIRHFARSLHYSQRNEALGRLGGLQYFVRSDHLLRMLVNLSRLLPAAEHFADTIMGILASAPIREADPHEMSMVKLLADLIKLCCQTGIDGVCVLMDNLDGADPRGEEDFRAAFHLARPLCNTHGLQVHKIENLIFKIFVPEEIYATARGSFRSELGERHIEWQSSDNEELSPLHRVLENRLRVYSREAAYQTGMYRSLSPLVEENISHSIDKWFVETARTPRELITLGDAMLSNHFRYPTEKLLLTEKDWKAAEEALMRDRQSNEQARSNLIAKDLQTQLEQERRLLHNYQKQTEQFGGSILPRDLANKIAFQKREIERLEEEIQEGGGRDE